MTRPGSPDPLASILLTGGTGFLGARVARRLLAAGYAVTLLARQDSSLRRLDAPLPVLRPPPTPAGLLACLDQARPDVVVHVASISRGGETPEDVASMLAANVTLPALLLAAMRLTGVTRFLNTGTSWQNCGPDGTTPFNLYAATKQACEAIIAGACVTGVRAKTLRLFDTYGPADGRGKIVDLIADAVLGGRALAMSPGGQLIDLSHVDDVAEAYVVAVAGLLADGAAGHDVYGVMGERLSLRMLAERIGALAGRPAPMVWGGRPYRAGEVMQPWSGYAPLPGWAPRIALDEGLAALLASRAVPA